MAEKLAPIVLFIYNRPDHTRQTLEALAKNELADQSELFVFADGPKEEASPENLEKIKETRLVVKEKQWCKNVTLIESEKNKGLADSIISGVTDIVNKYGKVIVLEDDLLTAKYFLTYMNDALELYKDELKVACIHGYVEPHSKKLPETFFLKGADCWGWSTWKRAWNIFNPNGQELLDELHRRKCEKHFNFGNSFDYIGMLEDQIAGKNNSWAIRWQASAYLNDMYCLYPGKTLVVNNGFDGSGTHCGNAVFVQGDLTQDPVNVHFQKIQECKSGWKAYRKIHLYRKRGNNSFISYNVKRLFKVMRNPLCIYRHINNKINKVK